MRVRWTTDAADDLERICDYIAEDRPESARRVAQSVIDAVNARSDALPGATEAEAIAVRCAREMTRTHGAAVAQIRRAPVGV